MVPVNPRKKSIASLENILSKYNYNKEKEVSRQNRMNVQEVQIEDIDIDNRNIVKCMLFLVIKT